MILLIDNYDSFTYNIFQAFGELGAKVLVFKKDQITIQQAEDLNPQALVISPGPGTPADAGICVKLIQHYCGRIPILGICLGHQCIVEAFGGQICRAQTLMHGKTSRVYHDNNQIYAGLSNPFTATRYHSLIVREEDLPADLAVSSYTSSGEIMGVRHHSANVEGVQFHPESILTVEGKQLLANFLELSKSLGGDHEQHLSQYAS